MNDILNEKDRLRISNILDVRKESMLKNQNPIRSKGRYSDCFVYVLRGKVDYVFSDYTLSVNPGTVIHIPYGSTYHMDVSENYHYIYVDFLFAKSPFKACVVHNAGKVEMLFERILRKWFKGSEVSYLSCLGVIYEIIANMLEVGNKSYLSIDSREHIKKAVNIISEKLSDYNFRVTMLAQLVGISTTHLRRLFEAEYNVSPNQFLRQMRLSRAKYLLQNTDYSLSEIAFSSGFCNEYYFNRVFKADMGVPPGTYRDDYRI